MTARCSTAPRPRAAHTLGRQSRLGLRRTAPVSPTCRDRFAPRSQPPHAGRRGRSRRSSSSTPAVRPNSKPPARRTSPPTRSPSWPAHRAPNCPGCSPRSRCGAWRGPRTGYAAAAEALAPVCPAAKELADLLAVPDDEVFLVLHPRPRPGSALLRPRRRGRRPVPPAAGGRGRRRRAPGARDRRARFVAACRDADPVVPAGVPMVAEARFQFVRPSATAARRSVPAGFRGCDHWLWPNAPLAAVPRIDGERVVLLGEPAFRRRGRSTPVPGAAGRGATARGAQPVPVAERLGRLAGRPVPVRRRRPGGEGGVIRRAGA